MTAPLLTVLITTYNYCRLIEQAIDSVLSQDYSLEKIQIVVVEDGSTDDTSQRGQSRGRLRVSPPRCGVENMEAVRT